ncbi:MAG: AraC family transcriptional regulator [Comamonadaceae bacterium]|nr:MAG: AraC family transcriptional regulator [Comamonadaceae bacterium]
MAGHEQLSLRSYGASPGSHAHDHFQVLVGLEGVLELEVEGRGQRIGAGDGFLVAPGDTHDFESAGGSRCLVLDTRLDLWSLCAPSPVRAAQMRPLASYLAQALLQHQPLAALHGPALLLEAWKAPSGLPPQKPRRRIDWTALAAWAQMRLHTPLTVAELAAQVHLSPSQFALRCHEAHGMSAMQWLRRQRLDRARLLRDAGLPVADVARRTGYRSPSALTAAMRRQR